MEQKSKDFFSKKVQKKFGTSEIKQDLCNRLAEKASTTKTASEKKSAKKFAKDLEVRK